MARVIIGHEGRELVNDIFHRPVVYPDISVLWISTVGATLMVELAEEPAEIALGGDDEQSIWILTESSEVPRGLTRLWPKEDSDAPTTT